MCMKKSVLRWVTVLAVLLPCLLLSAAAAEVTASGYCGGEGTNLTWTMYSDGELVISGSGAMERWGIFQFTPWYSYQYSIKKVTIDDGVTNIGSSSFKGCTNLAEVNLAGSVEHIQLHAFEGCTNLSGIVIPNRVTTIEYNAFANCTSLTEVVIPDSVTGLQNDVFAGCSGLVCATIGTGVRTIAESLFVNCTNLTYVTIPDNVTAIGDNAFWGCKKLKDVTLSGALVDIGGGAFRDCENLTSIAIPSGVTSIGPYAFAECDSLAEMEFLGDAPAVGNSAFLVCDNLKFYYHEGTTGWPTTGTWQWRPLEMIYNVDNYKPAGKHPEKEDHIFAGWYEDHDHKNPHKEQSGQAYAKFVHKDVFRIKAQVSAGTTDKSEFTDIRFVTTVDCLNYKKVGFKITFGGKTVTQETSTVYSSIVSNTDGVEVDYTPSGAFHKDSKYFVTMVLKDIPNQHFNDTFTVTPYWITQDGSVIEGVTNELRISMGFERS